MKIRVRRAHRNLLRDSTFFDREWYLSSYPDVAISGVDPVLHYLDHGASEGRDPSPRFSTRAYLARRPDVAAALINPLVHFLTDGIIELAACPPDVIEEEAKRLGLCIPPSQSVAKRARAKDGPVAVFVSHDASVTGAPAVLASVARWFQQHTDYDVRIVCLGGGGRFAEFEAIAPTIIIDGCSQDDVEFARQREQLEKFVGRRPAFTFINSIASGDYCRIDPFDSPRIAYVHELGRILDSFPRQEELLRTRTDHVLCDGSAVANTLAARGFERGRLSVRACFVDGKDMPGPMVAQDKSNAKAALGWSPTTRVVLGCGTVHWRKQPDVFVRMAGAIEGDVRFVWIGDGEDTAAMRKLAKSIGVDDRVEFVGQRHDFRSLMEAADVFALTSSEDPFPLVCLEAGLTSTPSVVFREAGGMASMVEPQGEPPAGRVVPLGNEDAFFSAVSELLNDRETRERLGAAARSRVAALYTTDHACMEILATVRRVAGLRPRVSVLVPVYNSAKYLQPRLDTIAQQTFKDVEIILRDDVSSDDSLAMLLRFAENHPLARVEVPETNSGSVFRAWTACLALAEGDLVWIAEADDACEPDFLEELIRPFATSGVRLAHGRSVPINADGAIVGDYASAYLDGIAPGRWNRSFIASARDDVNASLGRGNAIPNASGVIARRGAALRAIGVTESFRLVGDWAFYLTAIHGGQIAYVDEAVNYHRRHDATVTQGLEGTDLYFRELADANALARHLYGDDEERDRAFARRLEGEAERFGWTGELPDGQVPEHARRMRPPGVLYGVGDLSGGGAQMFAARFVNGWLDTGAPVALFTTGQEPDHHAVRDVVSPEMPILTAGEIESRGLLTVMDEWGLDVVVTGHWWADRRVASWLDDIETEERPRWTIVMHGCYENVLDEPHAFPDHKTVFALAERHCSLWVWTAEKNQRLFNEGYVRPRATAHIVNGFAPIEPRAIRRDTIGIPEDAVLFTLASRAIESKGWPLAVEALKQVRAQAPNGQKAHLLLIGDGAEASKIDGHELPEGVHRVRHTSRLSDYIAMSDVGLLPSWFAGESLPLVLIEFLAQGKPVIASDIGKIPWLLATGSDDEIAGIVVPRSPDGRVGLVDLTAAMTTFVDDTALAERLRPKASAAFEKFDFSTMIEAYADALMRLEEQDAKALA